ncbi:MAG: alcohol dehydrogenase catalytic domain-containing protein [bacterium]
MRAIVVREPGGTEAMRLEEVDDPRPGAKDVLIKVEACGVCFHEVVTRNGTLKRGVEMPLILGHEISGVVVETGPDVRDFKTGDRVATAQRSHICGSCRYCRSNRETVCAELKFLGDYGMNGGYAEYVLVEDDNVALVPDGVPLDEASIVSCAIGTELNAAREVGAVQPGDRVLVTGSGGGLGVHAIQMARLAGAFVVAVTTSPEKTGLLKELGAHEVVLAERGGDFSKQVKDVTGGEGVDVALDNVGSPVFHAVRRSMALGGRWVLIGQLSGEFIQLNPAQLFLKSVSLLSATSTTRKQLQDSLELVRLGQIKPVITERLPLSGAGRAHELLESGASVGRILLMPGL